MLTKKDNLLIRPWIVQRYRSHRAKVQSAGPAIDLKAPQDRPHVTMKHKKRQKEVERKKEIETENVRLVQKLSVIMNTLRLDNYWKDPRPNFLNRELIYKPKSSTWPELKSQRSDSPEQATQTKLGGSAKRCSACNPSRSEPKMRSNRVSPQTRIPWSTPKNNWNKTLDFEPTRHLCCRYCC